MRYGYFDDKRREYVITRPDTPLPWINYLGCEAYFGIISNTAGGYSFYRDARLRRLTRYRYNNVPLDCGGRYIYLRDEETGVFWSPSWQPVCRKVDDMPFHLDLAHAEVALKVGGIVVGIPQAKLNTGEDREADRFVPPVGQRQLPDLQVLTQRDEIAGLGGNPLEG